MSLLSNLLNQREVAPIPLASPCWLWLLKLTGGRVVQVMFCPAVDQERAERIAIDRHRDELLCVVPVLGVGRVLSPGDAKRVLVGMAPIHDCPLPSAPASRENTPNTLGRRFRDSPPRESVFHQSAATASPAWQQARDQYHCHLFGCRACYAPTSRHCTAGAELRQQYDNTPMEVRP